MCNFGFVKVLPYRVILLEEFDLSTNVAGSHLKLGNTSQDINM